MPGSPARRCGPVTAVLKFAFKWLFRLLLLAVVLVVILALSLDSLLRVYMEHNLRAQTGMDAEIGRVSLGWFEPRLEIRDLKIYNPAAYGGTLFLDIREIHVEYDRRAECFAGGDEFAGRHHLAARRIPAGGHDGGLARVRRPARPAGGGRAVRQTRRHGAGPVGGQGRIGAADGVVV